MSVWIVKKPAPGEQVRVNRGKYFHYGICVAPDRLVHFATANGDGPDDPSSASVQETDLSGFAAGGFVECLRLSFGERRFAFSSGETVRRALGAVGEKGYNVMTNNCLHFANRCLYGQSCGPAKKRRGFFASLKK